MKMSWASKSVQNNDKTIRNGRLFGFRAPQRLLRFQNASQGRAVCLELSAWSCLFGAVCLEAQPINQKLTIKESTLKSYPPILFLGSLIQIFYVPQLEYSSAPARSRKCDAVFLSHHDGCECIWY